MYSKKAKIMVAEQIVGMIENNVLNEMAVSPLSAGWKTEMCSIMPIATPMRKSMRR